MWTFAALAISLIESWTLRFCRYLIDDMPYAEAAFSNLPCLQRWTFAALAISIIQIWALPLLQIPYGSKATSRSNVLQFTLPAKVGLWNFFHIFKRKLSIGCSAEVLKTFFSFSFFLSF